MNTKNDIIVELVDNHFSSYGVMTRDDYDNILLEAEEESG